MHNIYFTSEMFIPSANQLRNSSLYSAYIMCFLCALLLLPYGALLAQENVDTKFGNSLRNCIFQKWLIN